MITNPIRSNPIRSNPIRSNPIRSTWAALALTVLAACGGGSGGTASVEEPADDEQSAAVATLPVRSGTWAALPPAPLSPRWDPIALWTGSEVVLWGGYRSELEVALDGGAYDPAAGSWRSIPPAPVPPRGHQFAHWTDDRLVVWVDAWSEGLAAGAVYEPDEEAGGGWHPVGSPPGDLSLAAPAVATADLLYVLAGSEDRSPLVASYDPASDEWRMLPPPPATEAAVFIVELDGDLYLWGCHGEPYGTRFDGATQEWGPVQPPPPGTATCLSGPPLFPGHFASGGKIALWPWRDAPRQGEEPPPEQPGAIYDPATDSWAPAAPAPTELPARAVAGDGEVVVWGGGTFPDPPCTEFEDLATTAAAFSYSIGRDRWRALDAAPLGPRNGHAIAWTGAQLLVWGGAAAGPDRGCAVFDDGAVWAPAS